MKMLDFKVKRFVGIIFHLILAQICLAQTGIANQNFGKDTLQLREVVVRATRPLAKLNSEGFVTEVKGTVLEELGFAKDVMGMLPGVLIMVLLKFLARENLSSISMDILSAIIWKLSN